MAEQAYATVRGDFDKETTLEDIRQRAELFAIERKWIKYHTPRNLALAMVGEVGELAELFQWRSDEECPVGLATWSPKHFVKLTEEISDVILYLVRLSNQCGVNLPAALDRKIRLNNLKYPMDKAMGNAAKYTEYNTTAGNMEKSGGVVDVAKLEASQAQAQAGTVSAATTAVAPAAAAQQQTDTGSSTLVSRRALERAGFFLAGVAVACTAGFVLQQGGRSRTLQ